MLTAIRQWVIKTMTKGQTGVVTTMPKPQLIEMNVQITAERLMRNGINPENLKTVGQVENVINQIDTPKVNVNPGVTKVKEADVMDMKGNKIDTSKGIMGGEEIKPIDELQNYTKSKEDIVQDLVDQKFGKGYFDTVDESEAAIKARIEADNKKGIKALEERVKKNKEYQDLKKSFEDPEKKADGGRIGYKIGTGKKGVQGLLDLVRKKFGKKSINVLENEPDFSLNILNDYNIARPESAVIRDKMKNFGKPGKFNKDGSIDYDYYAEILNDSENTFVYGDETIEELEKMAKARLDEIAEYKAMYDRGELDKYAPSKLDNVNDEQIAAAVDDIFPTGDPKYDAEMASEALVENNPQIFGDNVLLDDLDDATRSKIYGAVYDVLSNNMAKMRELKKTTKPEKTLKSMKEGKGINMSDPEIAEEFTRYMKETDPEGYKKLEQTIELSNFDPKGRKKNADGGIMRSAYAGGGMGRRGFLKLLGGVGAGIAGLKSGLVNIMGKGAGKEVAKEVVQKSTTGSPPPYFFKLAEKIKKLGDDATATTDRTIAKTLKSKDGKSTYVLEEDVSTGDTIIKKINKEGDEMMTDVEIMELKKGEVVRGPDGKPVKVPDEYEEVTEVNARIEGDVFNDPYYSDGIKIDEIMKEVGEQAPSIKKASGGIARMLGE